MGVILRLSDLKLCVHETLLLCRQNMGRKLRVAVLFAMKFLKVYKFQHASAAFLVIARCFALVFHRHLL
jgi:hypothetical protein